MNVWLNSLNRIELLPCLVSLANPKCIAAEERYNDAKWQLLGAKNAFLLIKKNFNDLAMLGAEGGQVTSLKSVGFRLN